MDETVAPSEGRAVTNGEVDENHLSDQLESLAVSKEPGKSEARPQQTPSDDGAESDSRKGSTQSRSKDTTQNGEEGREGQQPPPETGGEAPVITDSGPLIYRWEPVEPEGPDTAGTEQQPLTFPADLIAKDMGTKHWRPQGVTKKMMETYHIYQIKKPPSHHKNAKYVCRVCELHWDTLQAVQKHVSEQRHAESTRRHQELTAVHSLPEPTAAQTECLTALLTEVYREHGLTEGRLAERRAVADQLKDTLRRGLGEGGDCSLEVYGSCRHGCGFTDSVLDLALLPAEESRGAAQLTQAIQTLQDSELFTDVEHDFTSWTPHVGCVHASSGQRCQLALGAERDVLLARLVELYVGLDGRAAPLAVALRHLARVCEMDRPHAGSLPPSAFVLMTIFFLQQCEPPVLPALHQMVGANNDDDQLDFEAAAAACGSWRSDNTSDLGTLWLRMLRFYALELSDSDAVVSIRQRELVTRADKGWNSKKISIEDPVQSKRNISRSISSAAVADVMLDRLRAACLLFGVPRTADGPAIHLVAGRGPPPAAAARLAALLEGLSAEQMQYQFNRQLLCGEASMPVVCSICQKANHLPDDCPTLVVPPARQLPPPTAKQVQLLDRLCSDVFSDWAPPAHEYQVRENMLRTIEDFIRHQAFPSARLTLFGSSCNGFGFRNSDLDICLTFDDCSDPQSLDQPDIILKLAETLKRLRFIYNVIPISTAKVPIVKFTDRRSRLEADISLYNTLAQHNTLLLHTYAKLDSRARILGYMVKLMAKICDICDASRGSLSSYAYTLLLIYYLQRCKPAVLPVLQELDADSRRPRLVDGADVSFFTELGRLRELWPDAGRNTCSVGELWIGFLRFYGEHFDFERNVVCIRRMEVLSKFEKLWNGSFIAIEDPFLLSHNLGGGVRRKMASFIRRTFLLWRLHHMRPIPNSLPHGYRDFRAFLMSSDYLSEGPPPNAGGCHSCGRIGHWAADCPRRRPRRPPAAEDEHHQPVERRAPHPARESPAPPRQERVQPPPTQQQPQQPQQPQHQHQPQPQQPPAQQPPAQQPPAQQPPQHQYHPQQQQQQQHLLVGRAPALMADPNSAAAAHLLALLGGAGPGGPLGPGPGPGDAGGPRRVPGTHTAESLERQPAPRPGPPAGRPRPLGPPPGLAPPDLAQALLAQLRQPGPWPQVWPGPPPPWGPPWPGR
ncbi:terminal uridylyltransferase 4-like isoform X2 [Amphibalanus amphitrite]|uniref:terminal uridylyltransferase 4-like isoform X2 n=1 Tax=Amphibalanus amphitrite TaxID=1232801 RepID=UPI001C91925D|nr:terminal uridylyltransferase 4-like isoform X2 [Amphibalanus amphitrite]XP_043225054.1 terminal uridylyltransferase 4-like isoform X2 [Amphibalanus amphitrite]